MSGLVSGQATGVSSLLADRVSTVGEVSESRHEEWTGLFQTQAIRDSSCLDRSLCLSAAICLYLGQLLGSSTPAIGPRAAEAKKQQNAETTHIR